MAPTSAAKWVACHSGAKDKATGRLVAFADAPSWFRPSLTPREMLLKGMHGGIYFNPKGGKPGVKYPRSKFPKGIPGVTIDEYPKEWFKDVPKEKYLGRRYSTTHNCYGVKSGWTRLGGSPRGGSRSTTRAVGHSGTFASSWAAASRTARTRGR